MESNHEQSAGGLYVSGSDKKYWRSRLISQTNATEKKAKDHRVASQKRMYLQISSLINMF